VVMECINAVKKPAHLDVGGHGNYVEHMGNKVNRRVTYKLYPSRAQLAALKRLHHLHRVLYNAALEERIEAYRMAGVSISFADQCRSLTQIRQQDPAYLAVNAQSAQVTLKRLDLAFKAFFRRVEAGEEPGFPRFKAEDRFPGFGFKAHGDGFKFTPANGWRHGKLRLSGVGEMTARGEARTPGRIVCCDIQRKADGWFLSLVVECEPHRECGDREAGLDWGVETFATLAYAPGEYAEEENDRLLAAEQETLKAESRALSKALRGRRSKRAAKAKKELARRHRRVANRRKDRNHQVTARLVRAHKLIVTEDLAPSNMTASAKGTAEKPGRNVKAKAGLNRAILDATPGSFLNMLSTKAEEAGCELVILNTRKERPSQTCPSCGTVRKKALAEREHHCGCGFKATRDQAAALAMLVAGLRLSGREPTWARASEPETVHQSREAA
jgi:putative transposase